MKTILEKNDFVRDLIEFWMELDISRDKPFVHPEDRKILEIQESWRYFDSYQAFSQSEIFGQKNNIFHLGLLPAPYSGDIENADIYILMLNPGFANIDYITQECFFDDIVNTLKQDINNLKYPFIGLDPKFMWTGAGVWCERKLRSIIDLFMLNYNYTYLEALSNLSKRIAIIELFPYHSSSFSLPRNLKFDEIESVKKMKCFVKGYVIEKAKSNRALVIVPRSVKSWFSEKELIDYNNFKENIIIYDTKYARSASLSDNSIAFDKIKAFIKNSK